MTSAASGEFVPTANGLNAGRQEWVEYEFLGMSKPPEQAVLRLKKRLAEHVRSRWPDKVKSLSVRVRGAFVYVDAELRILLNTTSRFQVKWGGLCSSTETEGHRTRLASF